MCGEATHLLFLGVDERSHHVVYDPAEERFYIEDLDPTPEDVRAWLPLIPDRA